MYLEVIQNESIMNFSTVSAILRGTWLLDKSWAQAHLPIVANLLKGEMADFGNIKTEADVKPILHIAHMGADSTKVYSISHYSNLNMIENGSIAMVNLTGPMLKQGDYCSAGMVDQAQLISKLADSSNISGIILNIDTPGGQVSGTALLAESIQFATSKKPVISYINDGMAASAGMWIASAATEIYASQPTDMFGSIGVYTTIMDWASYYATLGMTIKEIYAPQSTDKNKGYYDALAGDETSIKEDLSVLAGQFINTILANRAGKIKGTSWNTGKMFYAADAKKIGLIDGIKSFSQVVDRINQINSQKTKKNNSAMAFEKTLVAAKAPQFAVTDEGFSLSEEHLNNVEAAFDAADISAAALVTANASIETLNTSITSLTADRNTAQESNTANVARIAVLEAEVTELGKRPSGKGTVITTTADENAEGEKKVPSYLDENNPSNQFADKRIKVKKA